MITPKMRPRVIPIKEINKPRVRNITVISKFLIPKVFSTAISLSLDLTVVTIAVSIKKEATVTIKNMSKLTNLFSI